MKVSMAETNNSNGSSSHWKFIYRFADKVKSFPGLARRTIWDVGREDPRRVVHALKVGLALTLVSLLYLMEPLFKGIGKNAMWAVMTVVVVMEFTVGATLCKGLNRGLGTLLAGSLAFLIEYVADVPGHVFRAVLIGAAVFLIEDPRRVVHALKVGLALILVSLLYLMEPLFKGIGKNAMWAVMTVVVVMEFTVGATLCKGLNRGLGTLLAGSLAFLIEYVADVPGHVFRAVLIGAAVFLIEDPRRVVHALKVGLALILVSLLYLMEPLFKGIGKNAMWAVMTVVVVMEFTVGATLCKGLNRGLGTLLAGSLAFLIEYVADVPGHVFRAVLIGAAVFLIGAAATYVRFIPYIKKNYDYGVMIFLLTFNLITVSSYRVDGVWSIAKDRISTIAIGCVLCLVIGLLVFPNWSGENLHKSTISKLEGLANSVEVSVMEYFYDSERRTTQDDSSEDPIFESYKAVLDSKAHDETLALQASWEPRYSIYCRRIPWQQYAKVGAALRHFSYTVVALHGCLQSEIQTPRSIRALYKDSCIKLAQEVSKVLRELANSIRNKRQFSFQILSHNLNEALQNLNNALKSHPQLLLGSRNGRTTNTPTQAIAHPDQKFEDVNKNDSCAPLECKSKEHSREQPKEGQGHKVLRPQLSKIAITSLEFSEALPFAVFTSLLLEMVAKLDHVTDEVEELGRLAHFREFRDGDDIVVTCETPKINIAQSDLPSYGGE